MFKFIRIAMDTKDRQIEYLTKKNEELMERLIEEVSYKNYHMGRCEGMALAVDEIDLDDIEDEK